MKSLQLKAKQKHKMVLQQQKLQQMIRKTQYKNLLKLLQLVKQIKLKQAKIENLVKLHLTMQKAK